jgi:hypothetical protein
MSPRLLTLLAIDAAPGDLGRSLSCSEGDRLLSSADLLSVKIVCANCGGAFRGVADSLLSSCLLVARVEPGGCSDLGVDVLVGCRTRLRCDDCDDWEAVEPWDGRRESLVLLHGWK